MSETLQNNDAARSPTGEILDKSPSPATTDTPKTTPDATITTSTTTSPKEPTQQADGSVLTGKAEPKVEGDKKGSVLTGDGKAQTPTGAPETYADFKVPDGYTLDADVAKEATTIFKALNLGQDQAQQLVDFYVGKTTEAF